MAHATFVKKAQKDIVLPGQTEPFIKKGESYYWWKFRFGGKHYSKTPPKPAQLTQSAFMQEVYAIQESIDNLVADDTLESQIEEIVSQIEELKSTTEDSLSNMPEGLQEGSTGQMLQERIDALDEWIDGLQSVDCSSFDEDEIAEDAREEVEDEFSGELASLEEDDIASDIRCSPEDYEMTDEDVKDEAKLAEAVQKNIPIREKQNADLRESPEYKERLEETIAEKKDEKWQELRDEAQEASYDGP